MPDPDPPPPRERSWLHWGLLVAGLYLAWFAALTLPLAVTCFVSASDFREIPRLHIRSAEPYNQWMYWAILGVLCLSQFLFLRVPVRLTTKRPVGRRSVWLPILVSGFWFGLLAFGAICAAMELVKGSKDDPAFPILLATPLVGWIAWSVVFLLISRSRDAKSSVELQSRWLLRGSILELLVAVPSHIIVRQRADCCAGFLTFVGITMGVTVMLLSFGPAVFLLYHARWKRLRAGR